MNLDTLYTANRIDKQTQTARLERTRQAREAGGSQTGVTTRLGMLLIRAGSRLQGIPQPTLPEVAIRAPESTHVPA